MIVCTSSQSVSTLKALTNFDKVIINRIFFSPKGESLFYSFSSYENLQLKNVGEYEFKKGSNRNITQFVCDGQFEFLQQNENTLTVFIGTGLNSNTINSLNISTGELYLKRTLTTEFDKKYTPYFYRPFLDNSSLLIVSQPNSRLEVCKQKNRTIVRNLFQLKFAPIDLYLDSASSNIYILEFSNEERMVRIDKINLLTYKMSHLLEIPIKELNSRLRSTYSGITKLSNNRIAIWLDKSKNDNELSSLLYVFNEKEQRMEKEFRLTGVLIADLIGASDSDLVYAALTYCNTPEVSGLEIENDTEIHISSCLKSNIFEFNINRSESEIFLR